MDVSSETFSVGKVTNQGKVKKTNAHTNTNCIPIKMVLGEIQFPRDLVGDVSSFDGKF